MKKEEELTKEERKYILDDLLSGLGGCFYGTYFNLTPRKLEKLESDDFDIGHKEFELIKSIIKKLKKW